MPRGSTADSWRKILVKLINEGRFVTVMEVADREAIWGQSLSSRSGQKMKKQLNY